LPCSAPDVDVIVALDVEDHVWEPGQRPAAERRDLQLDRVPGRSDSGLPANNGISVFERINEGERSLLRALLEVVRDAVLGILAGHGERPAWDSSASLHTDAVTQRIEVRSVSGSSRR
jgi:hypothetical protein